MSEIRQGTSSDKMIRKKIQQKDKDFSEKLKEEMEEQQKMLKGYFKDYSQPVQQDPTVMKRSENQQRAALVKQVVAPFRVFRNFYDHFWNAECTTVEEKQTLNLCKNFAKKKIAIGFGCSLIFTALTSCYFFGQTDRFRFYVGPWFHLTSFMMATFTGTIIGIIYSTRYSLQKFEELGQGYALGRQAISEIERFRMDTLI